MRPRTKPNKKKAKRRERGNSVEGGQKKRARSKTKKQKNKGKKENLAGSSARLEGHYNSITIGRKPGKEPGKTRNATTETGGTKKNTTKKKGEIISSDNAIKTIQLHNRIKRVH